MIDRIFLFFLVFCHQLSYLCRQPPSNPSVITCHLSFCSPIQTKHVLHHFEADISRLSSDASFPNFSYFFVVLPHKCCHKHKNAANISTVEPLTNDHPHQRPSLSYDHISCDGQWFLFVYESLTSDHPSYTTTPM